MKRFLSLVLIMILALGCLSGCGKAKSELCGKWAYNHDEETAIITLKSNGKAEYNNEKYSYTNDEEYIVLTGSDGEMIKMRYSLDKDGMLLYKNTEYVYASEGTPNGVKGLWKGKEVAKWTFEFTDEGTFNEDGYFPGYYTVNETDSSIKLVYNDHFEDTTVYYSINGNEIIISYPWRMVKMK